MRKYPRDGLGRVTEHPLDSGVRQDVCFSLFFFFAQRHQCVERQPGLRMKMPILPAEGLESWHLVAVRPSVSHLQCLGLSFLVFKWA